MPRDFVSLFPNKNTISILFLTALFASYTSYERGSDGSGQKAEKSTPDF